MANKVSVSGCGETFNGLLKEKVMAELTKYTSGQIVGNYSGKDPKKNLHKQSGCTLKGMKIKSSLDMKIVRTQYLDGTVQITGTIPPYGVESKVR